jgi:manganese/zinc/iron transport system substrate-binding protein
LGRRLLGVTGALVLSLEAVAGLKVVTTVGMVRDVVEAVAGERAEVTGLMGSGVDPHLYKPTRSDVIRLGSADLIIYAGLHLEGRMVDVLERMGDRGTAVLALSEAIIESGEVEPLTDGKEADPHLWMDIAAWKVGVERVRDFFIAEDPEGEAIYRANASAYLKQLGPLEDYAQSVLATIPERQRVLVTAHDAFQYFGRAYSIEVHGIQGISTESEAGLRDIEALLDFIVERGLPAIFVESSVSDKNVRALVEGARSRGHTLRIGGTLFSDAMGEEGTYRGTYIGMLDNNITLIAGSLGGTVPEGGLNGQL